MDRRTFMKVGVVAGAAQYSVAEEAAAQPAVAAAKTNVVADFANAAWHPITAGDTPAEVAVRQRVLQMLIETNAAYKDLNDTILKHFLNAKFEGLELKKFVLYGLFKNGSYEADKLMATMGIRWRRVNDQGHRKEPLVKMVALDETHIPAKGKKTKEYRRYLKSISRRMYDKLDEETPNARVDLVVQTDLASTHIRLLADNARHPGRGPDRPRLRERIAQDNTRFIEIELSSN